MKNTPERPGISYTLIRSRRKTCAIHITKAATVEVRAPLRMHAKDIDRFVASKAQWIKSHQESARRRTSEQAAFLLNYRDTVQLYGIHYPLVAKTGDHAGFDGNCIYLPPRLTSEGIRQAVMCVFKAAAKGYLPAKTASFAALMDVVPSAVRISGAKTRWGSCSAKNSITYSWRLIMADDDVVDYVVVHELAHIKVRNHSPAFWAVVEGVLPDYKARQKKLRQLQKTLSTQNWD